MCMEGSALQRICNFCIIWSRANTCDEHVESEILKTIVKRRELCYFPLKIICTWLWIGWFSYLHRHKHTAVLLFRKKLNSWLFFCGRTVPATVNVASHRGCCPCRTAITSARCCWELDPSWTGYNAPGPEILASGCPKTWRERTHDSLCPVRSVSGTAWTLADKQCAECDPLCTTAFAPCYSPTSFLPSQSPSATNQTLEKTSSAAHLFDSLFPLCLLSPSLL